MSDSSNMPQRPYYAVIFTSERTNTDKGYEKMAKAMLKLAAKQNGYLGVESCSDSELGITVSYWDSLEAINNWKENAAHQVSQEKGKSDWYKNYSVKICKVERDYSFFKS